MIIFFKKKFDFSFFIDYTSVVLVREMSQYEKDNFYFEGDETDVCRNFIIEMMVI